MIAYEHTTLDNGLQVVVHQDTSTPLAIVNIMYEVGSANESPNRTGLAHLLEHLMFCGSENVADFDNTLYNVGGTSNAFTSHDITNYYQVVPIENIETAFWLESDRLLSLKLSPESLATQKKVVIEEFKQQFLSQPYSDVWHRLHALVYSKHPYQWPVIGKTTTHVEETTLAEVKDFFHTYYQPNNAVLSVVGNIAPEEVFVLVKKWFGDIPSTPKPSRKMPKEPKQIALKTTTVVDELASEAIYMAFRMPSCLSTEFYPTVLLKVILSNGESARFYQNLIKGKALFSYITVRTNQLIDEGLFIIDGKLNQGVTMEAAEAAIWEVLEDLKTTLLSALELQKIRNKIEAATVFNDLELSYKAYALSYFTLLGDTALINQQCANYLKVTAPELKSLANQLFKKENCCIVYYLTNEELAATE